MGMPPPAASGPFGPVDRGDAALAKDDTFPAIESFSGAIALRSDAMLGYLKRGQAYRRRQLLDLPPHESHLPAKMDPAADAAIATCAARSEMDPLAPRPLELLGDVNYSLLRYDRAAEEYQKYVELDNRSPRVLYKLALAHYAPAARRAIVALQKAIALDDGSPKRITCSGSASATRSIATVPARAGDVGAAGAAMVHAREELADLYGRVGRVRDRLAQLEALVWIDPGPARQVALGLAYARAGHSIVP